MTDLPPDSTETEKPEKGVLYSCGRVPWADLAAVLSDADGTAWADYDGFHVGPPPTSPPPYTHLWAWHTDWRLRARLDGDTAIVGLLCLGAAAPPPSFPGTAAGGTAQVDYTVHRARTWPAQERRVGPLDPTVSDRPATLHQTDGSAPITFVSL